GPDHVAFHYLHVVDVIQQLDARRIHSLDDFDSKGCMVSLVALVVDLAVEQLDDDGYATVLGGLLYAIQSSDTVIDRFFVADTVPVAKECYQVWDAILGSDWKSTLQSFDDHIVIGLIIDSFGYVSTNLPSERADKTIVANNWPLALIEKVDSSQPHI